MPYIVFCAVLNAAWLFDQFDPITELYIDKANDEISRAWLIDHMKTCNELGTHFRGLALDPFEMNGV